jgi:hypothetical protein
LPKRKKGLWEFKRGREQNNIPDSDGFQEMLQKVQKRDRSDTVSTSFSDSHDPKRYKLGGIPE